MPTVSVIIPAYNQGDYLREAIDSVLAQTFTDFEVIVVDDGSTDHTARVAKSYQDQRVRYLYQENQGLSAARNTGIRNTTGQYLSFLDSDDQFLPEKLTLLLNELQNKDGTGLIAGQAVPIDETGNRVGKIFDKPLPDDTRQLLLGNPLHVGSVMVTRSWQEIVGFFDESLRSYEDWDMWLRLGRAGCNVGWVAKPVSLYRFHTAQMTRLSQQMTKATFAVLDKTFRDPDLPESWREMRDQAYSQAHLRAAAQAYLAGDNENAGQNLEKAVRLDPSLLANGATQLAAQFMAWTELPKVNDRLGYLESIYNNLPKGAEELRKRRNHNLGNAAVQIAFEAYQSGDHRTTRAALLHAIRHEPKWLFNRGVLAIFVRSYLSNSTLEIYPASHNAGK
ncbi:MAG TPA: glycosyltransferase [Anaerolineales bacterium]|nr:glycosyltransferase [Anaerolineales bacterium]